MVDLQKLVQDLCELADLTEMQITEELRQRGIEVSQPTINRLRNGKVSRPAFHIGAALIALHKDKLKPGRAA